MPADLIILVVFVGALAVAGVILGKKLPRLASLDVTTIPKERHAIMKELLVADRLERKLRHFFGIARVRLRPIVQDIARRARAFGARIETLEHEYRQKARMQSGQPAETSLTQIQALMATAADLVKEGEYAKAERQYIEVIGIAPNDAEAFEGLGEVYLLQKDFTHAKESFDHAVKLKPNDAGLQLDLAAIERVSGNDAGALALSKHASELSPNDPKILNTLLDDSLAVQDKKLAEATLARLVEANPENQSLDEYRAAIAELPSPRVSHKTPTPL